MTLTIPTGYGSNDGSNGASMTSFEVASMPVLSGQKPVQLTIPNDCIRFEMEKVSYTFHDCDEWSREFYACNVNKVHHQMNRCLNDIEDLRSELDVQKVSYGLCNRFQRTFRIVASNMRLTLNAKLLLSKMVFLSALSNQSN